MIETTVELRVNESAVLKPFENEYDFTFLYELIRKYPLKLVTTNEAIKLVKEYGFMFWNGFVGNIKLGVPFVQKIPYLGFTLDGYIDYELKRSLNDIISYSYYAGKLVTDFMFDNFTDTMFTIHSEKNRGATILCKKLGYKIINTVKNDFGIFLLFEKRRTQWV